MTGTLHLDPDDPVAAVVIAHAPWTGPAGHVYPAATVAHVAVGGITVTMTPAQAAQLRDALTAALEAS